MKGQWNVWQVSVYAPSTDIIIYSFHITVVKYGHSVLTVSLGRRFREGMYVSTLAWEHAFNGFSSHIAGE